LSNFSNFITAEGSIYRILVEVYMCRPTCIGLRVNPRNWSFKIPLTMCLMSKDFSFM